MIIKEIKTERVLSRTQISIADYVINPYRGCLFGCAYCYSAGNKTTRHKVWGDFLEIKANAPEVLARELLSITPRRVLLGSTTECFHYAELRYRITEQILRSLNGRGIPYTILTRSDAIRYYVPLIRENPQNKVYVTLGSDQPFFKDLFEPRSPFLRKRIEALSQLRAAGIQVRAHISPVIPYVVDVLDILSRIHGVVDEVGIEFYNAKMGPSMFSQAVNRLPSDLGEKIRSVYANKESYQVFFAEMRSRINEANKTHGFKLFFVFPPYDEYYSNNIVYE